MPLVRGNTPGLPTLPDDGQPGRQPPIIPEIGVFSPSWIAPDGTRLALNPEGSGFMSLKSVSGLGAAPVDIVSTPSADGGTIVEFVRPKERSVIWPLRMRADTHLEFLALWRQTVELFTQCRRLNLPGTLRLRRPDGTERQIPAWYSSGFEQDPEDGAWTEVTSNVNLYCPSPFWVDSAPVTKEWLQEVAVDYLNPYPSFGSGQVIGAATILNDGVTDAWPTWTIRGPMTSLVALNVTRNETFTITYTLLRNETLTMTTRPVQVRGKTGEQAVSALNLLAGGIPWRLNAASTTSITFTAAGAAAESVAGANDGTSIQMSFNPKRETA